MTGRPIVIQTMWRTGATYVSFMLRERNPVALFSEPLHESFSQPRAYWDRFVETGGPAWLGHPIKSFSYATDYPFTPDAGVEHHRTSFAYDDFVLRHDSPDDDLRRYLLGLTRHAATLQRRPLFKFCRCFLRQPWIDSVLHPITVFIARSPRGMLASYRRLAEGAYFFSAYARIIYNNRRHPIFHDLAEYIGSVVPEFSHIPDDDLNSDRLFRLFTEDMLQDIVLFFWALAAAAHCRPHILVLDANDLGANRETRTRSAEALGRHTGLDADFSDARPLDPDDHEPLPFRQPAVFRALTRAAVELAAPGCQLERLTRSLRVQMTEVTKLA